MDEERLRQDIDHYIEVREILRRKEEQADRAWDKWFLGRQSGERRNGAAASRLANEMGSLSADVVCAETPLWRAADELGLPGIEELIEAYRSPGANSDAV